MIKTDEILEKIIETDLYKTEPLLFISEHSAENDINADPEGVPYIGIARNRDIPVGFIFTAAISSIDPAQSVVAEIPLYAAYPRLKGRLTIIPQGPAVDCFIGLDENNKALMSLFSTVRKKKEQYISGKHDFIYLTTDKMLDKMREIMETPEP
jgi:hypothetical protein